jgi:hypothetical protein
MALSVMAKRPGAHKEVRTETILEAVCACHLASYVPGPVEDRGGVMFIGPPGVLKSTFLDVLDEFHNAAIISNLNTQTLMKMQGDFISGNTRTIAIPELQAIYKGDPRTSARLEQALMQLVAEGHRGASWQDTRRQKFKSRAMVFGAMTPTFYDRMSGPWEDSGFLRRFIWVAYTLQDPDVLMDAITQWKRAEFGGVAIPKPPANNTIPDSLSVDERREIRGWLKHQPAPHEIQFSLLCRATAALRWHYATRKLRKNALDTMREFAATLQKDAAVVRV